MKKLVLIIFLSIVVFSCDKDDDNPTDPINLLPPATQTGANTAGALVNGEPLLPKGGGLAGNKLCYYQYVDGGYHFLVRFSNSEDIGVESVGVGTQHAVIEEGKHIF